jgi:hypothetical protein
LIPASPTQLPSLANRIPALAPSAPAGNGVPDKIYSSAPAYEPRSGGAVLGVPALNLGGPRQLRRPTLPQRVAESGGCHHWRSSRAAHQRRRHRPPWAVSSHPL